MRIEEIKADFPELKIIAHDLASFLNEYIKKGYTLEQIAELFAKLFIKEFKGTLDVEAIVALQKNMPLISADEGEASSRAAASHICLRMALGFTHTSVCVLRQGDEPQE